MALKNVKVKEDIWIELHKRKLLKKYRSMSALIEDLLKGGVCDREHSKELFKEISREGGKGEGDSEQREQHNNKVELVIE